MIFDAQLPQPTKASLIMLENVVIYFDIIDSINDIIKPFINEIKDISLNYSNDHEWDEIFIGINKKFVYLSFIRLCVIQENIDYYRLEMKLLTGHSMKK